MSEVPFMPKATAVWLVENTTLTFKQIAKFCNLHELEVKGIADGDVAKGIKAYNPIIAGQLSRDEINNCSKDPEKDLNLTQRNEFVDVFKDSLLDTYAETLAQWENQKIVTIFPNKIIVLDNLKNIEVRQELNTGSTKYPISYKLRKNKNNSWSIVNIIVNGVNLGLTFRNQFQALANKNNGDIEDTLEGWVSDAGDAGISG